MWIAKARQQLAPVVDDADPRAEIRAVQVYCHGGTQLADIADRLMSVRHEEPARPMQIVPLRLVLAVAVENLDAVVLAVGDIDPAVGVAADIVDDIELAGIGARLAP